MISVLPVVVVARTRWWWLAHRFANQVTKWRVLDFSYQIFHIDRDYLPAWDRTRSTLFAVLTALMRDQAAVQVSYHTVQNLRPSRDGDRLLAELLPLNQTFD